MLPQEIGTRNGDGMACFARVASAAAAYEIAPKYCTHLQRLSGRLHEEHGRNFTIHCACELWAAAFSRPL